MFDVGTTTQLLGLRGCTNVDDFTTYTYACASSLDHWTMFEWSKVINKENIAPMSRLKPRIISWTSHA
jgi:hypothetical protein